MAWPDTLISTPDWLPGFVNDEDMETKITDRLNLLVARMADTGYITTGLFSTANGTGITNQTGRIIGNRAYIRCEYTVNATTVTALGSPGTNGDLSNTTVLNIILAAYQPTGSFTNQAMSSAGVGRVATHVVQTSDNTVKLCAVAGSAAISNGDSFSFYGSYLLD